MCSLCQPQKVAVSKQTHHYLELYTNNYGFLQTMVEMKGIGREPVYFVSNLRGRVRGQQDKTAIKNFDGKMHVEGTKQLSRDAKDQEDEQEEKQATQKNKQGDSKENQGTALAGGINLNDLGSSIDSGDQSARGYDSHRGMLDRDNFQSYQQDDFIDNESNKSDQIDDGTMNVFGFNDDLNLDDRLIIQNATDNQIYNLVERPKYLLSFELKDSEQEFLFTISQ